MKSALAMVVVMGAVLAMVANPAAAGLTLTVGGGSSISAYPYGGGDTQTGLGINTSIVASPGAFTLNNPGDSHSFPYFEIWTDENDMNPGNDPTPWVLDAYLDLSPPVVDVFHGGVTFASTDGGAHGVLDWDSDGLTTVTAGCVYTVQLTPDPTTFNWGSGEDFGGTGNDGYDGMALVTATVTLVECAGTGLPPIPEPASLGLVGMALLVVRKRRS